MVIPENRRRKCVSGVFMAEFESKKEAVIYDIQLHTAQGSFMQYQSAFRGFSIRKIIPAIIMMPVLSGCMTQLPDTEIRDTYVVSHAFSSAAQNERIRFLVLHYTAQDDEQSLKTLTGDYVSAHYLVSSEPEFRGKKPLILQLVDENKRAWHAGVSSWNGRTNINDSSVGIEIVNMGYTGAETDPLIWQPYSEKQIEAVKALAKDIIRRYQITPDNVIGHSDVAPLRKTDPGVLFPWRELADEGIGAWPEPERVIRYLDGRNADEPADVKTIQVLLKQYGYDQIPLNGIMDDITQKTISAFQMHFRPGDISGRADAETEAIAAALVSQYRRPEGK